MLWRQSGARLSVEIVINIGSLAGEGGGRTNEQQWNMCRTRRGITRRNWREIILLIVIIEGKDVSVKGLIDTIAGLTDDFGGVLL